MTSRGTWWLLAPARAQQRQESLPLRDWVVVVVASGVGQWSGTAVWYVSNLDACVVNRCSGCLAGGRYAASQDSHSAVRSSCHFAALPEALVLPWVAQWLACTSQHC
jgi:hypothetical protein